jgi:hypothetical protein
MLYAIILQFWRTWTRLRFLLSNDLRNGSVNGMIWPLYSKNNYSKKWKGKNILLTRDRTEKVRDDFKVI